MELSTINIVFVILLFIGLTIFKAWIERRYQTVLPTIILLSAFVIFLVVDLADGFSVNKLFLLILFGSLLFYTYFKKYKLSGK